MKLETISVLHAWVTVVETNSVEMLGKVHGARFDFRGGAYEMRLAGVAGTSTMSREGAKESWLRAARKKLARAETESAPVNPYRPQVKSAEERRLCREEREAGADPINLQGSGPAPITVREG